MENRPKSHLTGMFPLSSPTHIPQWQADLQRAFRKLPDLLGFLDLGGQPSPIPLLENPGFPFLVPESFAQRMVPGDWNDPLLRQVLPTADENRNANGFIHDAVGDLQAEVVPGVLHKYKSRALLMVSPNCAVHCRYCFRKEFPYEDLPKSGSRWESAWRYLEENRELEEVILSGGDPLFLEDRKLGRILEKLSSLEHVHTVRIHTRLPIVLPSRVDDGLLRLLKGLEQTCVLVVHANHPSEIKGDCRRALMALRSTGAILMNQTVLLKGVNDNAEILTNLSRELIACGTLPYYLHQLDRVTGTGHFEVEEEKGRILMAALLKKLPGYAIPRYVREIAGETSKTPVIETTSVPENDHH